MTVNTYGRGGSFPRGRPGKGMYNGLYNRVLNRHAWAQAAPPSTASSTMPTSPASPASRMDRTPTCGRRHGEELAAVANGRSRRRSSTAPRPRRWAPAPHEPGEQGGRRRGRGRQIHLRRSPGRVPRDVTHSPRRMAPSPRRRSSPTRPCAWWATSRRPRFEQVKRSSEARRASTKYYQPSAT